MASSARTAPDASEEGKTQGHPGAVDKQGHSGEETMNTHCTTPLYYACTHALIHSGISGQFGADLSE